MKPMYLYHGSGKKIQDSLIPKKASDKTNKDNSLNGVYATNWRKWAIIMGIFGSRGIKRASTHITGKNKIDAVLYEGYPKQDYFYLYTLPSKTFKNKPKGGLQWVSLKAVKPKKIEKLAIKDYIHLIRKATKKEKKEWTR